jgi:hypothetical protein
MSKKKKKEEKPIFICRHKKRPIKRGECWDCGHETDPNQDESDPRADSWASCKRLNKITEKWHKEKQEEYKKNPRKLALVMFMDMLIKQDNAVEDIEEALLLVRLEYKK